MARVIHLQNNVNKLTMNSLIEPVRQRILKVYCDCRDFGTDWELVRKQRELDFKSDQSVTRDEAIAIIKEAIPVDYNLFEASLLKKLPKESKVWIAREGSVCIYVEGCMLATLQRSMRADEFSYDEKTNQTRIWWD